MKCYNLPQHGQVVPSYGVNCSIHFCIGTKCSDRKHFTVGAISLCKICGDPSA